MNKVYMIILIQLKYFLASQQCAEGSVTQSAHELTVYKAKNKLIIIQIINLLQL